MNSYSLKQEFENICFRASVSIGTYDDVYKWFMEFSLDSYDWVMIGNVYSMALWADGGMTMRKPYISGDGYIMKMGKMWSVIDGKPTKLEKDIITKEGTKVLLDGTIVKKDKQRFVLKENEKVDAKGEILSSR